MILKFNPQSLEVKQEGRKELAAQVGLDLDEVAPFFGDATFANFQVKYNNFVTAFGSQAIELSKLRGDGVGPGEMVAWFVFDNIRLGGKNSPIDLLVGDTPFAEMKGGAYTIKTNSLDNFKVTKDSDLAVTQLIKDLDCFNETHQLITGKPLAGYQSGKIKLSQLNDWRTIDLKKLARKFKGVSRTPIALFADPADGTIRLGEDSTPFSHWDAKDLGQKIREFSLTVRTIPVDNNTSTISKIENRWRATVEASYLVNKKFALVNKNTMQMMYFGELTKEMIGLYLVGRNQPWARVYLPSREKEKT